jgi:hypothetical protein
MGGAADLGAEIPGAVVPLEANFLGCVDALSPPESLFFWVVESSGTLGDCGGKLIHGQGQQSKHKVSKDFRVTTYANEARAEAVFETGETAFCR